MPDPKQPESSPSNADLDPLREAGHDDVEKVLQLVADLIEEVERG